MALVELFRATGERRYLELAARMIELRGHGLLGIGRLGSAYWQDHAPVRDATTVAGHAVRQLYLDSGAVDVATELGDRQLLDAVVRRWHDMIATRTYLTGGLGQSPSRRGVRRSVRVAARPGVCGDVRGDRLGHARLAPAAGDRRPGPCRHHRADRLQRGVAGPVPRWHGVLLRQRAAASDRPGRRGRALRDAEAVVRLRLLSPERDAVPEFLAAVPRNDGRGRHPDPPIRDRRGPHRARRRTGPDLDRDGLPMGWRSHGDDPRDAAGAVDVVPADPRLVRIGDAPKRPRRRGGGPIRSPSGGPATLVAGRRRPHPGTGDAGPGHGAGSTGRRGAGLRRPGARSPRVLHRDCRPPERRGARGRRTGPVCTDGRGRPPGSLRDGDRADCDRRRSFRSDVDGGDRPRRRPLLQLGEPVGRGDAGVDPSLGHRLSSDTPADADRD